MQGQPVPIRITPIHTIQPTMPLTTALSMLVEASISALPVVDAEGALLDVYARGDITLLARGNAYSRLQCEDMTVGHALALAGAPGSASGSGGGGSGSGASFAPLRLCGLDAPALQTRSRECVCRAGGGLVWRARRTARSGAIIAGNTPGRVPISYARP